MKNNNGKIMMTIDDVATALGYSPQTVRRLAQKRVIPLTQLAGRKCKWRIPRAEFDRWIAERYVARSGN